MTKNYLVGCNFFGILLWLSTLSTLVSAEEWKYVGVAGMSTDQYDLYLSRTKPTRDASIATMKELHNFKYEQFAPEGLFNSETQKWQYDCVNKVLRRLETTMHRWKMAQGDIIKIEHEANSQWTGIHPGTVSDSKWKVACEILN